MLLSKALGINQSQPLLDFVDIDLFLDFPLYIDPLGFINPRDDFAQKCQDDIRDFFDTVLKQIASGNSARGQELLLGLREPNETHLGQSQGKPAGRGIGLEQAELILAALQNSPAAKSGLLKDLTDTALFVPGIGADKISDMTTNIIRRHLIEYTQQQFELMKIQIATSIPTGLLWDTGNANWIIDDFDRIPVINGVRVLLVPKRYVRWRGALQQASSKYYNHFVTNFIRDEQLKTNGRLVEVVKTKNSTKRVVWKKSIHKEFPLTKPFLAEFSVKNPKEYAKFRRQFDRFSPIGIRTLMEKNGKPFNEMNFDKGLVAGLAKIAPGRPHATAYHHYITGALTYLFYPHLISPALEQEIDDGRKRLDLAYMNTSEIGFFKDRKDDPFTVSREVIVECKNYSDDIANPELDQLGGRFDPRRGRFGMIVCRTVIDQQLVTKRCRDMFQAQRGIVIVLCDEDIIDLLNTASLNRDEALQNMLRAKLRAITV